jgi:hypothetical protein
MSGKSLEEIEESNAYVAAAQKEELRKEHPWVYDLVRILAKRPDGLTNQQIYREMESLRPPGLPIPRRFHETIRNALNSHHGGAAGWRGKPEDELFRQPKGRGHWAIDIERATAWVEAKGLPNL